MDHKTGTGRQNSSHYKTRLGLWPPEKPQYIQVYGTWQDGHQSPEELAGIAAKPLSTTFENLWQSDEGPDNRKRGGEFCFSKQWEEDFRSYWPASHTSVPGNIMEQIPLDALLRHTEYKEVIQDIQFSFYSIYWWSHFGRAMNNVSLNFYKAFDKVHPQHSSLIIAQVKLNKAPMKKSSEHMHKHKRIWKFRVNLAFVKESKDNKQG